MKKLTLPNGLTVSAVALGAMDFGTTTPKEAAFAVLDAYLDMGGNFVDTSNNLLTLFYSFFIQFDAIHPKSFS